MRDSTPSSTFRCTTKIADFGMSRQLANESDYFRVVERSMLPVKWMAPECLELKKFTHKTDVWSFGIVLWEIMALGKATSTLFFPWLVIFGTE